jgi:ribose transport system substrate-binding protein
MSKKLFVFLSLLIIASMMLAACGGGQPAATQAPVATEAPAATEAPVAGCQPYKAGYVEFQTNIFYDAISKGLKEGVDASGGELLITNSGGDLKKELAAVENFLSQNIDVLFISMSDPVGSMEAVRKANEAGVPVVAVALGPDPAEEADIVTFIRSNDYKAASEVAEYILKQIGYKGDVVLADGPQVSVVLERMKAYKDVIAKYPDVKIAGQAMKEEVTIPANATMIENLLTAAPNAVAVFDYAGYGIPAAATVLPNLGRENVWVGEIDGIPEEIELLASGAVKGATAQQQPYLFGKQAVDAWMKYCENPSRTDIPPITEVPTLLITNENAKDFQTAPAATQAPAETEAPAAFEGNPNAPDFTVVGDPNEVFDLNGWYAESGVEANTTIKSPGAVRVPDDMTTAMPKANEKYTIGFSVYYTVDEVGAMILESMKAAAEEAGVELLVNDANYDQNAQNQAIEQWILQGVDGVILAPCDFTGVKTSLDALEKANIPVVTLNAPLAGGTYAAVISDTVEQGQIAGELLEQALLASGKEMKGPVVYQTLPFMHPNAATRAKGFKDVFTKYPDIEIVELTGISPEEHYNAFDGAIKAHPDMLGAWGLYSSATIGMLNAKKANGMDDLLLSSVDNDKPILAGIYNGEIVGTAAYSSIAPARWCMSEMVNLLNGVPIPGIVFYENMTVTKDNVEAAFEHYYPGKTLEEYMAGETQ